MYHTCSARLDRVDGAAFSFDELRGARHLEFDREDGAARAEREDRDDDEERREDCPVK